MDPQAILTLDSPAAIGVWVLAHALARSGPAAVWALCARSATLGLRVTTALLYGSGCAVLARAAGGYLTALACFGISGGYFGFAALLVFRLGQNSSIVLTRPALFGGCAVAFVLFPALAFAGDGSAIILPFGLDVMLSAYSYLVESRIQCTGEGRRDRCAADALFFLLVNPTLVHSEMGTRVGPAQLSSAGMIRILLGSASMAASVLAAQSYRFVSDLVGSADDESSAPSSALLLTAEVASTYLAAYWGHSGAASVQIGWMQLLGWKVPERYHYPFLAVSPLDFWRRWNIYWGCWLRRYVFHPMTHELRAASRRLHPKLIVALAVVGTFFASGVLHDFAKYAATFDLPLGATAGFVAFGLGVILWEGTLKSSGRIARSNRYLRPIGGAVNLVLLSVLSWLRVQPALPGKLATSIGLTALGF